MQIDTPRYFIPQKDPNVPYQDAIDELKKLTSYLTPAAKIKCAVRVTKQICKAVDDHRRLHNLAEDKLAVGGDELLALVSYVVLKSGDPTLLCQAFFMVRNL